MTKTEKEPKCGVWGDHPGGTKVSKRHIIISTYIDPTKPFDYIGNLMSIECEAYLCDKHYEEIVNIRKQIEEYEKRSKR